ncbi:MAG: 1-deoxy-D-xylulose-5-phosphate reductoisomerase [Ruminococcaceae bacterium]|nr:1-deoxy-D-xylulose-5-phosphate reductoisomerase [Oscillospiraceae bacterium]
MAHNISILGSTGSIGTQSLDIVSKSPDINVLGLCANNNIELLEAQARKFKPKLVCAYDEKKADELKTRLADTSVKVVSGTDGMCQVATIDEIDTVLTAVMGFAGLRPTIAAIESGKNIALANKETMVAAGLLVTNLAKKHNISILPVDSEHSAIFQSLSGMQDKKQVRKIILTASGGPFYKKKRAELENITPEMALKHPNWSMGAKITIDSSTLVNKGLEVIEAKWLFDIEPDNIDVLVHPQSIIHSMVEYIDGSVIAQLGQPDMHLPIAYALTYPDRTDIGGEPLDLAKISTLTFDKPDTDTFPALPLAYKALKEGGTMSAVYNAADEACVDMFFKEKIRYLEIADVIGEAMSAYTNTDADSLENICAADAWAREYVYRKFL